jgi:hypothetical protein
VSGDDPSSNNPSARLPEGASSAFDGSPSADPRPVPALFEAALAGAYDCDAAWNAVTALQLRDTPEVLETAVSYVSSPDPRGRARGLDVLAQLGANKPESQRPYRNRCIDLAIRALADPDPQVLRSAAWALAHWKGERAVAALLPLRRYRDPDVRHAVACGMAESTAPEAIDTLVELSRDSSPVVRDWATFALGLAKTNSATVLAALRERLDDPYPEARDEALWALARRRDRTGLRLLIDRLETVELPYGDEIAARDILHLGTSASRAEVLRGLRSLLAGPH